MTLVEQNIRFMFQSLKTINVKTLHRASCHLSIICTVGKYITLYYCRSHSSYVLPGDEVKGGLVVTLVVLVPVLRRLQGELQHGEAQL